MSRYYNAKTQTNVVYFSIIIVVYFSIIIYKYDEIVGKEYQTEYECMNNFLNNEAKLIWHPSKKLKINGKYCIAIEYDRTGLEGMVKVKKYIFLYDGKEIDVTMSYRESEKDKYADDFEKVINSFKIIG